eukprot:Blabericola_migrator_1__13057@NODE_87_length_14713_cov_55_061450_g78_i0_p4_GENE_NODE_87_length_14713_cov_55_061450_g78_i0NODE_87_length_14713_cov_55_061450_g78_i0_p4_ORF_typecomplete_len489_score59_92ELMO_CED12/PF04727_13/6_9e29_NODE_87_length_14713_cov_55_061450_g78_i013252791
MPRVGHHQRLPSTSSSGSPPLSPNGSSFSSQVQRHEHRVYGLRPRSGTDLTHQVKNKSEKPVTVPWSSQKSPERSPHLSLQIPAWHSSEDHLSLSSGHGPSRHTLGHSLSNTPDAQDNNNPQFRFHHHQGHFLTSSQSIPPGSVDTYDTQSTARNRYPTTSHNLFRAAKGKLKEASCWGLATCGGCVSPCLPISLLLSRAELQEYYIIFTRIGTPVDPSSPLHRKLLSSYWSAIFPRIPEPPIPSWHWQLAGFQSSNPWTDFRGGGLLALQLMVLFAQSHQQVIETIVHDCLPELRDLRKLPEEKSKTMMSDIYYPYSAAFINITFALICFLRLNTDLGKQLEKRSDIFLPNRAEVLSHTSQLSDFIDDAQQPLLDRGFARSRSVAVAPVVTSAAYLRKGPKVAVKHFGTVMTKSPYNPETDFVNPQFVELFSAAATLIHREWCRVSVTQNLLGFGEVLTSVMDRVHQALTRDSITNEFDDLTRAILV